MKEFIEAGIKGGLDVADSLKKLGYKNVDEFPSNHFGINADDGVEQVDFCFEKKLNYYQVTTVSFQALIFSTDIVECVVGGGVVCFLCGGKADKSKEFGFYYCTPCSSSDDKEFVTLADYHRSIMAQEPYCKDIEKLKEYCRGLVK